MAMSADVTVAQNGGDARLHPYIIALVRWCVNCVWSTATLMLHRLMTGQLPQITGLRPTVKPRPASKDHLHPEPKVECQVLYEPDSKPKMDVIFVHGLYGSLGNTWRQGDWRSKYKIQPNTVPLRRASSQIGPCDCKYENNKTKSTTNQDIEQFSNKSEHNKRPKENEFTHIDEEYYEINSARILPNDNMFITEKFYRNTIFDQVEIIDNYETQAKFVSDLFKIENECDNGSDCDFQIINNNDKYGTIKSVDNNLDSNDQFNLCDFRYKKEQDSDLNGKARNINKEVSESNEVFYECQCKRREKITNRGRSCEVGCGCVCDVCYSPCWPRDWIKEDYPDARVISINYTSDPYLWRPLWVKEIKRLRLHERAEQMTKQLLDLGVGERPIIWVGHSKGGLFIKQIYCEAYEAHKKVTELKNTSEPKECLNTSRDNNFSSIENSIFDNNNLEVISIEKQNNAVFDTVDGNGNEIESFNARIDEKNCLNKGIDKTGNIMNDSSKSKEDVSRQSTLWSASCGFMFYSVPHRGSPLADFKTPLTARSVELLEISKDCSLVLSLQERWLRATAPSLPVVRSLVETCRTLMSVFWLRIVSVDSADPGIGALCGISLDHREICKPSSRRCTLYKELMNLMHASLNRCHCSDS